MSVATAPSARARYTARMPASSARVHWLNALRGLLAIGIMAYHLLGWTRVALFTTLGTYGVYAFFALSGFALEWAYGRRLHEPGGIRRYGAARIGRILPLYAGAALVTAAMTLYAGGHFDRSNLLLNVSLTFGFFNPGATSSVVGGWSIGIELVFYALFPIIAWLRLETRWLILLASAALALRIIYVDGVLPAGTSLSAVWVAYSQMPLFLGPSSLAWSGADWWLLVTTGLGQSWRTAASGRAGRSLPPSD